MEFLDSLNPQQREAVEHTEGPLLILAGAGSGKTRVITYRIVHLIRSCGVWPGQILAVTFTNKAAGEMRDRVVTMLGPGARAPLVTTFHAFCVRLLRREGEPLARLRPGFTRQFSIYDDGDQLTVIRSLYKELGLDEKMLGYRSALGRIGDAKTQRIPPERYVQENSGPLAEKIAVLYDHYQTALRRANALDFDDLLIEGVRLLAHDEATRERMRERFHYLLVDEYQDTNRLQYDLVRLLADPRRNLCVVGDEDQSIYAWRGADINNILDFERHFPEAVVIRLEQNYRSTGNILEAASGVVAHNRQRKGKKLWTEAAAGSPLQFYEAEDAEREALYIADAIQKYLREDRTGRAAVLYRTNFQSRLIEEALRRSGRKYVLVGGLSFYQRAEIKDLLGYLKAALNRDPASYLRIINTPARGIGRTTVEQIQTHARESRLSFAEALEDLLGRAAFPPRAQAAVGAFQSLMQELREKLRQERLNYLLVWLKERTGYERMLQQDKSVESESRLENINELINAAADSVGRGETLEEFLDHAALVADTDALEEAAQVTLLTAHSAKGLEFDFVVMAGMEDEIFPHSRALEDRNGLEEERRLCYVGMTRARKRLVLTRACYRRRYGGGEMDWSRPSRFLAEIPPELLKDLTPSRRRGALARDWDDDLDLDLYAERQETRQVANVAGFFGSRGRQSPAPPPRVAPPQWVAPPPASVPRPKPARTAGFRAGAQVRHTKYGLGTVVRREGEGADARITVSFHSYGLRKILERYATLTQE